MKLSTAQKEVVIHERIGSIQLMDHLCNERLARSAIRLTPYCRAKFEFLRDYGSTEITAYGITLDPKDPLLVHDIIMPKQECTSASVDIDTEDLSGKIDQFRFNHNDTLHPYQINSIWMHTHPGSSASPSGTDDNTFAGKNPDIFFIMYILAKGGEEHAEMKINGVDTKIYLQCEKFDEVYTPTEQDKEEWTKMYKDNVSYPAPVVVNYNGNQDWSRYTTRSYGGKYQKQTTPDDVYRIHKIANSLKHSDDFTKLMALDELRGIISKMEMEILAHHE